MKDNQIELDVREIGRRPSRRDVQIEYAVGRMALEGVQMIVNRSADRIFGSEIDHQDIMDLQESSA